MSDFIKVTAAVILKNDKVLITQRHVKDIRGNQWEFPGGKIEPGETPEACLRRELREELGIEAGVQELILINRHAYPDRNIELMAYRTTIQSGQIALYEHQAYRWAAMSGLLEFDWCEADIPVVELLMNPCP